MKKMMSRKGISFVFIFVLACLCMTAVQGNSDGGKEWAFEALPVKTSAWSEEAGAEAQIAGGASAEPYYENLGTALKRILGIGGAAFTGPDGRQYISGSINGVPAQFVVFDALTLEVVNILNIPGTTSTSALLTGADGNVYIGTTGSGEVYRYTPGADELELIGQAIAGETHIFDLANGPDGIIYGGTYPRGKLFELDLETGTFTDYGTPVAGESYLRQLVYDAERDLIIAGTGTNNRLAEIDLSAGTVSDNLLPDEWFSEEYPNSIDLIGDKLFIQLNKSGKMIVMDKWTKQIESELSGVSAHVISSPDGDKAYYFSPGDAYLHAYDLESGETTAVYRVGRYNSWKSPVIFNVGTEEEPDYQLSAYMGYDRVMTYNFAASSIQSAPVDAPGQPILLRSLTKGPDGKIYAAGSQGGMAIYDPETGQMASHTSGISQAEGGTVLGDKLYFGIYPQARIAQFDTTRPWGSGNPAEVAQLPSDSLQDRPFAMLGVEEYNKVFIGTVPQYGQLGGALAIYDPETGTLETYRNIVQDQSVITLAYHDGKVYGGTSIWGAYGAPAPTSEEGKLFVWDIELGEKVQEIVPVAGKDAVTSLIIGPDGNLWGFNEGVLFIYDFERQEVMHEQELFPVEYRGTLWTDAFMLVGKDGNVYGTAWGKFFRIDADDLQVTILDEENEWGYLTQDDDGRLYMRPGAEERRHELWRYADPALTGSDASIYGLMDAVEKLTTEGEISHAASTVLMNHLAQSEHHYAAGRWMQALHHLTLAENALERGSLELSDAAKASIGNGIALLKRLWQN